MRTERIDNTNFQGKLIILNDLSHKPYANINKIKDNLVKQIESKKYDLYIGQDYSANKIRFAASHCEPRYIQGVLAHEEIPITANASRYIYAAKNAINRYEKAIMDVELKNWEQKRKQQQIQECKDVVGTLIFSPLYVMGSVLSDVSPKLAKKYEELLNKIGL